MVVSSGGGRSGMWVSAWAADRRGGARWPASDELGGGEARAPESVAVQPRSSFSPRVSAMFVRDGGPCGPCGPSSPEKLALAIVVGANAEAAGRWATLARAHPRRAPCRSAAKAMVRGRWWCSRGSALRCRLAAKSVADFAAIASFCAVLAGTS